MIREQAIRDVKRALDIVERQWPELADGYLEVPLEAYSSEAVAALDRELFETSPLALLASSEIAKPNDYHVRMSVGRSILLTRDAEGRARAFLNYCRHRGAEPARGCGNARVFLCPYHGWSYDTKGRLTGMPLRDRFKDLDMGRMGLVELPCEERHGFVWVVLRPGHPIDVASHLGPLDAEIASIGAERMTYFNALPEEPLETNWKSVTEGLLEGLHVPFVHAGTFATNPQALDLDLGFFDAVGKHVRWVLPMFTRADVARIRATPESEWKPNELVAYVWWVSPNLTLAHEYYGLIYADLSPGEKPSQAVFRYGWISPILEAPPGLPSPEEMASRTAVAVRQDKPVWEGCGRGLRQGAHGAVVIGRNEPGLKLMHESVARQTGYAGLRVAKS
ncbi:MAG: aromatic ring-hydroxylating dioxygenase subunit alpha [Deltaproteobacteria bacterium]|nr:aromatic ring-hydroxylating dioxygenase subunit alpha [Deltaproteobacteria bacterium]